MKTGALLLAAGYSNRFGGIKLGALLPDGQTVFQHTLGNLNDAVKDVLVISREELLPLLVSNDSQAEIRTFAGAESGMGATLAFGITQVDHWDACLVCLADMPLISIQTYRLLCDALRPDRIVLPSFNGKTGNPVGFGHAFFAELRALAGDAGGRQVIQRHADKCLQVDVDDPGIHFDIDTPADLAGYGE
ncbi:MAG: nucleotidyltransferase family protein [Pseudohongiellaceae bacterium]